MALYKYGENLDYASGYFFDTEHSPGDTCPASGIYQCSGCGREACCNRDDPFPPQNHHQHNLWQGLIRWKLVVAANAN